MRRSIRVLPVVLALLLVAACGDDSEQATAGTADAAGTNGDDGADGDDDRNTIQGEYVATEVVEDGRPRTLVEGTTIRLRLTDGALTASAGCNTIGGDYTIDDGALHVDAVTTTEMGCDQPRADQDEWLAAFLSSTPALQPVEEGFVLSTDAADITFVDHSVAEPDRELIGTAWVVDGYVDGVGPDDAVASAAGSTARLVLDDNGYVTGHDGCNEIGYAGEAGEEPTDGLRYEVEGDHISFSGAAVTTDIGCPDVDIDRFWAVLSGTVTWEVDGSRLTLLDDAGRGVIYQAEA